MKWNRDYIFIAAIYLVVLLYIAFFNNPYVTSILVVGLLGFHVNQYLQIKRTLESEKDTSLSKLQTRLKKTERRQSELSDRFDSLSQSFGSGLLMVDEDGIIQYSNYDMNDYFQFSFLGVDYQKTTPIKELYQFINESYLLESSSRKQIEYQGRVFDLISTPLFENEMFKGALILAHDITQIKHAEEYQKRFTADVSHELRTPLSAIRGFSEILMRDGKMNEAERTEFTELIFKEAKRMEVLLKDLSEIAKLDRIDFELEKQPTNIKEFIQNCLAVLSPAIQESGLLVSAEVEPVTLLIDADKMSQVITNIVKNAINYTDEGSITISGHTNQNRYKIEITDTGIGIKESDFDKIFKRFYRVDKARSRVTGGSGLGLSISKNVVLRHGGSIAVRSTPDVGSTFIITLPMEE